MYINLQNLKEMLPVSTKYTDNELMMVKCYTSVTERGRKRPLHVHTCINTYLCKVLKRLCSLKIISMCKYHYNLPLLTCFPSCIL